MNLSHLTLALDTTVTKRLDPLVPMDFLGLAERLGAKLWRTVRPVEQASLAAALEAVIGVDWRTDGGVGKELDDAARELARIAEESPAIVTAELERAVGGIASATRASLGRAVGEQLGAMSRQHAATLEHLATSQGSFVTNAARQRIDDASDAARRIVARGIEQGLDNATIAGRLKDALEEYTLGRSEVYYDQLAATFTARARSFATLATMQDMGVRAYRWTASMDSRCCQVCRFLHGQTARVSSGIERMRQVESMGDPEAVRDLLPWPRIGTAKPGDMRYQVGGGSMSSVRADSKYLYYEVRGERRLMARVDVAGEGDQRGRYANKLSQGELERAGLMVPPCHGRCRCRLEIAE